VCFSRQRKVFSKGLAVLLLACPAAAQARSFFTASRALGMGDAFTAVGTGFEAVYYNPAGIAKRNQPRLKIVDIETTVSQGFAGLFSGDLTKVLSTSEILKSASDSPGKPYSLGLAVTPQFLIKNFSLGVVFRGQAESVLDADSGDTSMYSYADLGAYVQYGISLMGGILKLGVGGKLIDRAELRSIYTGAQVAAGDTKFGDNWAEGLGFGADAGMLLTFPMAGLPTLGLAVLDIGNTKFSDRRYLFASGSGGRPEDIAQKVNVGSSIILKHGRGSRSVVAVEFKDAMNVGSNALDHFHAGIEIDYMSSLFLRGGVNQGYYWTAGLGFALGNVGLEFASYGEDLASADEPRLSDRKWVGRYVVEF
jgi:hypothetical protein